MIAKIIAAIAGSFLGAALRALRDWLAQIRRDAAHAAAGAAAARDQARAREDNNRSVADEIRDRPLPADDDALFERLRRPADRGAAGPGR